MDYFLLEESFSIVYLINFPLLFIRMFVCAVNFSVFIKKKARSKLPKKRRRVLPVEQPRRKRGNEAGALNRRMTLPKPPHPANAIFKDAFGSAKIGKPLN